MQNAENTQSKADINKDYLDTREVTEVAETSLAATATEAEAEATTAAGKKAKVKRSRFSVALRSFSLSRSKKDRSKEARSLPVSLDTAEPTFSSGAEDSVDTASTDSKPTKKKSKLSRRFLLGNLKKSKVHQKSQDVDNASPDKVTAVGSSRNSSEKKQNKEINTAERASSPTDASKHSKQTTVKITISGKKIEPSSGGGELKRKGASPTQQTTAAASALSETDYLTPLSTSAEAEADAATTTIRVTKGTTSTATTTTTTTTTIAGGKGSRTTKVIVSKVGTAPVKETSAHSSPAPSSSPFPAKAVAATLVAKSKKIKSKRATAATSTLTSQTPTNSKTNTTTNTNANTKTNANISEATAEKIVITQSTQDTPPPERAPLKPSRVTSTPIANTTFVSSAQSAAAAASQTGAVRKPTTKLAASSNTTTTTSAGQTKQHHHASTTPAPSKKSLRSVATVAVTAVSSKAKEQQRGHRISRPSTITQPSAARSTHKAEVTKPQTRESSSTTHRTTAHALPTTPSSIHNKQPSSQANTKSVVQNQRISSENEVDADAISSAESAQPTEYVQCSLQEELAIATGSRSVSPASPFPVQFAVGSAVRPLSPYETAGNAALASAEHQELSSSDSQSDSSSLRRIRYQTQTLYGDHDSIQGRREILHYQSVASEAAFDTEEYDSGDPPMPAFGDLTMDQEMEPTIMTSTSEKREHLYKILVIGELGTGKTSFIKRYVHQFFSQNYRATIGVDFALKVLHWDPNTIVRLQLWDIAGQERFGNMTRVYYKEAVGAFIVFDVTRSGTFDCVTKWKEDLDSKVQLPDGNPIPCILLANKCDQDKQGVVCSPERMDEYVQENGFAGWFETSAKENINIDEAARALVNKILLNDKLISDTDLVDNDNRFNLNNPENTSHAELKSKCAC